MDEDIVETYKLFRSFRGQYGFRNFGYAIAQGYWPEFHREIMAFQWMPSPWLIELWEKQITEERKNNEHQKR